MSIERRFSDLQVEVNGLVCAGKQIHDILIDAANIGGENVAAKYMQVCAGMPADV